MTEDYIDTLFEDIASNKAYKKIRRHTDTLIQKFKEQLSSRQIVQFNDIIQAMTDESVYLQEEIARKTKSSHRTNI